jgi:hypothetical protein
MSNPFDDTPFAELYGQVEEMMDKRYERTERKVSNFSRKKGDVGRDISCTHCQHFHDIGIDVMNIMHCEDCLYQFQS